MAYNARTVISGNMSVPPQQPIVPWIPTQMRRSSMARVSVEMKVLPAYLIIESENGLPQRFNITKVPFTIGRRDDRDIVLQCQLISKDHAVIDKGERGYVIHDTSTNGIYVNEEKIHREKDLEEGNSIEIGSILLTFHDEVEITPDNWEEIMESHPAFSEYISDMDAIREEEDPEDDPLIQELTSSLLDGSFRPRSMFAERATETPADSMERRQKALSAVRESSKNLDLVTILKTKEKYDETITVRAELNGMANDDDFLPYESINDEDMLKNDYEKLRMAYELSKVGLTDIDNLLGKMLELMFSVLPVDRGVVLLIDRKSRMLATEKVKLREGKGIEHKEILLSETILKKVCETKRCLITSDAFEDPSLNKAKSIMRGQIRSVLCVPLIAHNEVHGVLHLDSQDRINAFAEKDLALVKAISNQTAIALENCKLLKDIEKEVTIRENLGRFLPPHVVDRVIAKGEEPIKKGGRQITGTILFADIRGFTQLSEKSSPQEVVDLLNDFFERLVRIVFKYDGVLDKYIGDCLMAAFGTLPGHQEDSEVKAVQAALEFKVAIAEINAERTRVGKEPISIGVGLNTGPLVAGYIGSSQRLEYTCIGDSVNTASRVCSVAAGNQVLISEFTYALVRDRVVAEFAGRKSFKGKTTEVDVYEVISTL